MKNIQIMASKGAKLKKYDEAIIAHRKAAELEANNSVFFYNLGLDFFELEQHQEALDCMIKSIYIQPENEDAYQAIIEYFYDKDHFENVIKPKIKSDPEFMQIVRKVFITLIENDRLNDVFVIFVGLGLYNLITE